MAAERFQGSPRAVRGEQREGEERKGRGENGREKSWEGSWESGWEKGDGIWIARVCVPLVWGWLSGGRKGRRGEEEGERRKGRKGHPPRKASPHV